MKILWVFAVFLISCKGRANGSNIVDLIRKQLGKDCKTLYCPSNGYAYKDCNVDTAPPGKVRTITFVNRISNSACTVGVSYGFKEAGIWVDKGCRANFEICYTETPMPVPTELPNPSEGPNPPDCNTLYCPSNGYAYKDCNVDTAPPGKLRTITLAKRLSNSACTEGVSYGFNKAGIWVDKGCRANFEICYTELVVKTGECPAVRKDAVGICIHACSSDGDCDGHQKCCSNGCGQTCMDALETPMPEPTEQPNPSEGPNPPAIVTIHTPDKYLYQSLADHGIDVTGRTSLVFAVRACNDAHVALFATEPNMNERNFYEIVIGGWGNSQSVIRNTKQGQARDAHRARLLDCKQPRPFWISWGAGMIAVGTGEMVGENTFMTWTDPTPYKVNFAAVSSGWGSTADWEFDLFKLEPPMPGPPMPSEGPIPPAIVTIHTPDKYLYQSLAGHGIDVTGRTSLVFAVRACNDAHVALFATEPNMKERNFYEIVIGGWGNSQSVIRNTKQGNARDTHRARLLDCKQPRHFWISWGAGIISVGTGEMVGENTFMTWTDPTPYTVNFAAVSSGWGSTADWEFDLSKLEPSMPGPPMPSEGPTPPEIMIHTPDKYLYQSLADHGIDVTGRTSLVFAVRACNDAHVALFATEPNMNERNFYEIVIGGWGNSQSVIRNTKQGNARDTHRARLLDCKQPRHFWISWGAGIIVVGTGEMVGENTFMTWTDPTPYTVNFAAVSSGWGSTAEWEFDLSKLEPPMPGPPMPSEGPTPPEIMIHTPDKYLYQSLADHGIDVTRRTSLVFAVRACNDAHVALFATEPNMKERNFYEIVIGGWGNSQSVIRNTKQGHARDTHRARLLDCKQPRHFWMSWGAGIIVVGTGEMVGENTFMTWTDPTPYTVNFAAVSSGWGSTADWEFDLSKLEPPMPGPPMPSEGPTIPEIMIHTPDKYLYQSLADHGIDVTGRTSLVFAVRACNDAHVALFATEPNMKERNFYEIVIGGWGNSQSVIRNTKQGQARDTHRARLLDCKQPRHFWISWGAGIIGVGTGEMVGENTFMTWTDPTSYTVNFAAVSSGWGSTADWEFDLSKLEPPMPEPPMPSEGPTIPEIVTIHTPDKYLYQSLSDHGIGVKGRTSLVFTVRACNDAHVALFTSYPSMDKKRFYEIVIGGWANSKSVIRNYKQGRSRAQFRARLLSCKEARDFWISWGYGIIKVGKGEIVGENTFMKYTDRKSYRVNFAAVSSGWGSTADWKLDLSKLEMPEELVMIHTPNRYLYKSLSDYDIDVTGKTSLVFGVRACNDAHLALFATEPNMKERNYYEIVIGGWRNRKSVIRNHKQGNARAEHRARLLNCNRPKKFWISWGTGVIAVGQGGMVGEGTFMTWTDPTPYKVNFAAVSSGWGSTADWGFNPSMLEEHLTQRSNPEETSQCNTLYCPSNNYAYNECEVSSAPQGRVRTIEFVNRVSNSPCTEGASYGYSEHGIWVNNGCRANFEICYEKEQLSCNTLYCPSNNYAYKECDVSSETGPVRTIKFVNKVSNSACTEGESYGFGHASIWVKNGCRANFEICHAIHDVEEHLTQRSNPEETSQCNTLYCPSNNYVYNECEVSSAPHGRVRTIEFVNRVSNSPCTEGASYGYSEHGIWVNNGCRANFEICYENEQLSCNTLYCPSNNYAYKECDVSSETGPVRTVKFVNKVSNSACTEGESYGFGHASIWVKNGCRANFEICHAVHDVEEHLTQRSNPEEETSCNTLYCPSNNYAYNECEVSSAPQGRVRTIEFGNRVSNSPCTEGASYGYSEHGIWVNNGCRANFEICYEKEQLSCNTLYCPSNNYAYKECDVSSETGPVRTIKFVNKVSNSACTEGESYGFGHASIWVKNGCRANFEICHAVSM